MQAGRKQAAQAPGLKDFKSCTSLVPTSFCTKYCLSVTKYSTKKLFELCCCCLRGFVGWFACFLLLIFCLACGYVWTSMLRQILEEHLNVARIFMQKK